MSFNKFLIFILIFGVYSSYSQQDKSIESPKFTLKMNMNRNTLTNYKFIEVSDVTRILSDSSTRKFKRESIFYYTLKVPNTAEEGFSTFEISIDSLNYKFTEDNEVYEYNSQDEKPSPVSFEDLKNTVVPLGKEYNITYSPYGEIVKIEGESLDWLKNYVVVESKGTLDSLQTHLWLDGISKSRLASISDAKKISFPISQVCIDSAWKSFMEFQVMNITCLDSSKAKIVNINNGVFRIMGESTKFNTIKDPVRFYGFKDFLVNITKAEGVGKYDMVFGPRGLMRSLNLNYEIKFTGKVKQEVFNDFIKTKQSWEMINQYKY
jgi:hypothetical protein